MASIPSKNNDRCICAVCLKTFLAQDDNTYRMRNLNDMCRVAEVSHCPPLDQEKKGILAQFGQQLDHQQLDHQQPDNQRLLSLCYGCNLTVGSMLKEITALNKYEAAATHQQEHLNQDLAELNRQNFAVLQQLKSLKEAVESSPIDSQLPLRIDIALNAFRNRLAELANQTPSQCFSTQKIQPIVGSRRLPAVIKFVNPLSTSPPRPSTSHNLATDGFVKIHTNLKRKTESGLETGEDKPSKRLRTAADGLASFTNEVIRGAQGVDNVLEKPMDVGFDSAFLSTASADRMLFGNVVININEENRSLECGKCGWITDQLEASPEDVSDCRWNMKVHVLTQHHNKRPFSCTFCKEGFLSNSELQEHVEKCLVGESEMEM